MRTDEVIQYAAEKKVILSQLSLVGGEPVLTTTVDVVQTGILWDSGSQTDWWLKQKTDVEEKILYCRLLSLLFRDISHFRSNQTSPTVTNIFVPLNGFLAYE